MQRDGLPLTEPELVQQCEREYEDAAQHGGQVGCTRLSFVAHFLDGIFCSPAASPRLPIRLICARPSPSRRHWMLASGSPGRWCTRPRVRTSLAASSLQRRCLTTPDGWTKGT